MMQVLVIQAPLASRDALACLSAGPTHVWSLLACMAIIGVQITASNALELNLKRSKPAVEPVPRGQAHHIYKVHCSPFISVSRMLLQKQVAGS